MTCKIFTYKENTVKYLLKQNEEAARQRLHAFWAGSSLGRPALIVRAKNPDFVDKPWEHGSIDRKERDFLPEWHMWNTLNRLDRFI
jgi:hypothetical protein